MYLLRKKICNSIKIVWESRCERHLKNQTQIKEMSDKHDLLEKETITLVNKKNPLNFVFEFVDWKQLKSKLIYVIVFVILFSLSLLICLAQSSDLSESAWVLYIYLLFICLYIEFVWYKQKYLCSIIGFFPLSLIKSQFW